MSTTHPDHHPVTRDTPGLGRPLRDALVVMGTVDGFYLLREHWNHVVGNWIYLLLLACPLMHLFHGHGGHGGHGTPGDTADEPAAKEK